MTIQLFSRLLLAVPLLAAPPVVAEVIWRGDFETGTTKQWSGPPKSDLVKVVTEPVREGKFAVRIDGTNAARRGKRRPHRVSAPAQTAGHRRGHGALFRLEHLPPQEVHGHAPFARLLRDTK